MFLWSRTHKMGFAYPKSDPAWWTSAVMNAILYMRKLRFNGKFKTSNKVLLGADILKSSLSWDPKLLAITLHCLPWCLFLLNFNVYFSSIFVWSELICWNLEILPLCVAQCSPQGSSASTGLERKGERNHAQLKSTWNSPWSPELAATPLERRWKLPDTGNQLIHRSEMDDRSKWGEQKHKDSGFQETHYFGPLSSFKN